MSTFKEIITRVDEIKPNAFSENLKLSWLTSLNGKIAADVFLMDIAEIRELPHGTEAIDCEPLVGFPHEEVYDEYLAAKIDAANGEANEYQNRMQIYDAYYINFVSWFKSTYDPVQGNPNCHGLRPKLPTYYITAYGLAVMHGFTGTLEQWLESLTAYGIAKKMGFEGSVEEWLSSLKGESMPSTNYEQTDSTKADYLKGKDVLDQKIEAAQTAADNAQTAADNAQTAADNAQTAANKMLPLSGGTMTGPIAMGGKRITGLAEPTAKTDAATKQYADTCQSYAQAYADAAAADAKQYTNTQVKAAAPYNLLDNSDFSNAVDQRGMSSYIATAGSTIDRWKTTSKLNVARLSDCIELSCTATSSANGFTQLFEFPPDAGTPLTLAVMEADGTLNVGSVEMPSSGNVTAFRSDFGLSGRVYTDKVAIMVSPGKSVYIKWAALYVGEYTAETLPNYRPKGYSVELAECQRYFRVVSNGSGYAGNNAYIFFPFEFRITPTATVVELGTIRTDGSQVVPTGVTQVDVYHNSLRLTLSGTYPGTNQPANLFSANIQLSADL